MKQRLNVLKALLTGRAIVIAKSPDKKKLVDVLVGNEFSRCEVINSLASTLRAIAF